MKFIFELTQEEVNRLYAKAHPANEKIDAQAKQDNRVGGVHVSGEDKPVAKPSSTLRQTARRNPSENETEAARSPQTQTAPASNSAAKQSEQKEPAKETGLDQHRHRENNLPAANQPATRTSLIRRPATRPAPVRRPATRPAPIRRPAARTAPWERTAARHESDRLPIGVLISLILIPIVIVGCFLCITEVYNPAVGRDAQGNVISTRLDALCHNKNDWLYAKSYDFDGDGTNEIFYLKTYDNDNKLYFGILKEGELTKGSVLAKDTLNLTYGIYEREGKYFVGMPALYYDPDAKGIFTFRDVEFYWTEEDNVEIDLIEDENDIRLSQYHLVSEFPFDNETADYSQFQSSVQDEIQLLRDSYKEKK